MKKVELAATDWCLDKSRGGFLVYILGLIVMHFSETRNIGVRAGLKREDDESDLGQAGLGVLIGFLCGDIQ